MSSTRTESNSKRGKAPCGIGVVCAFNLPLIQGKKDIEIPANRDIFCIDLAAGEP
jgi:hypothetical protein